MPRPVPAPPPSEAPAVDWLRAEWRTRPTAYGDRRTDRVALLVPPSPDPA